MVPARTHIHTHARTQVTVKVLAVICGGSNLELRGRPRGRTRWLLCAEPKQLKRRRGQMVVSDQVID